MEKKNTVLLTVIAVATLLVAVVGATFAYFSATVTENDKTETVIKAAQLGIVFTGTAEITSGDGIVPGWTATKKFTVENTSDYEMSYDINWTDTTNGFERQQDLTYSMTASYTASKNSDVTVGTTQVNQIVSDNPVAFNTVTGQLPATSATEVIDGATVNKPALIARVVIPAHTTQEFVMVVSYANAIDENTHEPVSQNVDQGKEFRTTIRISANGIQSNATRVPLPTSGE